MGTRGNGPDLGMIRYQPDTITTAEELTIDIELENTGFKNSWNIWVSPDSLIIQAEKNILITREFDQNTIEALKKGLSVLLMADSLGNAKTSTSLNFYPLYWSLSTFRDQGNSSLGFLIRDKHPAFRFFPTDYHSDWQWEPVCPRSKGFILNSLPPDYKPIVQVVDDFHRNNKIGAIFELKVGKGKLLVCGFPIVNHSGPVARQLFYSLLKYAGSDKFDPNILKQPCET